MVKFVWPRIRLLLFLETLSVFILPWDLTHFLDFRSALGKLRRKLSICKQFVNKLFDP